MIALARRRPPLAGALTVRRAFTNDNAVIEASLFSSREFATASAALFLFFIAFATLLLISVLYLQDLWHYSRSAGRARRSRPGR